MMMVPVEVVVTEVFSIGESPPGGFPEWLIIDALIVGRFAIAGGFAIRESVVAEYVTEEFVIEKFTR